MEFTFRSSGVRLPSINHHAAQPLSPLHECINFFFLFTITLHFVSPQVILAPNSDEIFYFFFRHLKKNLLPCHKYLKTDFIIKFEFKSIGNPATVHNFYRYKIKCTELFSIVLYFLTLICFTKKK